MKLSNYPVRMLLLAFTKQARLRNRIYALCSRVKQTEDVDRPKIGRPCSDRSKREVAAVHSHVRRIPASRQCRRWLKNSSLNSFLRRVWRRTRKLFACTVRAVTKKILFIDKKVFTIEQKLNCQNNRVYARSSTEAPEKVLRIQRGHHVVPPVPPSSPRKEWRHRVLSTKIPY